MLNTLNINLKTDIKNDRPTALGIKLMSQDKNNNQFILRFTNGGEPVTLDDTYTVEVLTKFSNSGASRLTSATVRQDYATWQFDTEYITQDEMVYNYVYVRKAGSLVVSADANCFVFNVGLSEIDKGAGRVAEVYDENYEKVLAGYSGALDERTTERLDKAVADFNQRGDAEIAVWRDGADSVLNLKADKADLDDLSSLLGWHTAKDVVGLEADFENSIFTRLSGAVGLNAGSDFDKIRAFGGRRRCILSDGGEVLAYYGDANYIEDGSLGQVMVEQPKFYYKVVPLKIEPIVDGKGHHLRKARYYVSDTQQVGFKVHPAFVRNGEELNKIYLSAYDGSLYDVSEGAYNLTDAQTGAFTVGTGDKLSSIANAKPASGLTQNLTRSGARIVAQNRGTGWELMYAATAAATQLLFAVEYGTFNTQSAIGMGVLKTDDGASNMAEPTGATALLGNDSGKAENGSITYRGEENFWMNIYKWVDGLNIKPQGIHELYVADTDFADDKGDGSYKNAGITLAKVSGYISAFAYNESFDWLFFPSETVGNSSVPVGDNFFQNAVNTSEWVAAIFGSNWALGALGGGFFWHVLNLSTSRARTLGARIVYVGGAE